MQDKQEGREGQERKVGREGNQRQGEQKRGSGIWNWRDREGTNGREGAEEHEGERGATGKAS